MALDFTYDDANYLLPLLAKMLAATVRNATFRDAVFDSPRFCLLERSASTVARHAGYRAVCIGMDFGSRRLDGAAQ